MQTSSKVQFSLSTEEMLPTSPTMGSRSLSPDPLRTLDLSMHSFPSRTEPTLFSWVPRSLLSTFLLSVQLEDQEFPTCPSKQSSPSPTNRLSSVSLPTFSRTLNSPGLFRRTPSRSLLFKPSSIMSRFRRMSRTLLPLPLELSQDDKLIKLDRTDSTRSTSYLQESLSPIPTSRETRTVLVESSSPSIPRFRRLRIWVSNVSSPAFSWSRDCDVEITSSRLQLVPSTLSLPTKDQKVSIASYLLSLCQR